MGEGCLAPLTDPLGRELPADEEGREPSPTRGGERFTGPGERDRSRERERELASGRAVDFLVAEASEETLGDLFLLSRGPFPFGEGGGSAREPGSVPLRGRAGGEGAPACSLSFSRLVTGPVGRVALLAARGSVEARTGSVEGRTGSVEIRAVAPLSRCPVGARATEAESLPEGGALPVSVLLGSGERRATATDSPSPREADFTGTTGSARGPGEPRAAAVSRPAGAVRDTAPKSEDC